MFLGIDIHDHEAQVAVVDDDGNLQDEIRLPIDRLDDLAAEYAGGEAAIEASGNYRAVYEMLDEHLDVTVANPSKNRLIADATVKTDRLDAKRLAHLLHAGMVAESYVPEDEIRELRDLVRTRKSLVEEQTAEKNRVRAVLKRTNNTYDSELFGPTGREFRGGAQRPASAGVSDSSRRSRAPSLPASQRAIVSQSAGFLCLLRIRIGTVQTVFSSAVVCWASRISIGKIVDIYNPNIVRTSPCSG